MRSRFLTLILAVLAGVTAVALVYLYINRVEERSVEGLETRPVMVANRFLPAGTTGSQILEAGAFELQQIPIKYVAPGAFTSADQLGEGVLATDVVTGEQLTSQRFEASLSDAFLSQFPKGTEALSIPLDFVKGAVSGHVQPGDEVNAFVTAEAKSGTGRLFRRGGVPSSARFFVPKQGVTALLLAEIPVMEVLGVGPPGAAPQAAASPSMTLAVTPEEAALLIHAQQRATLWFTLVPQEAET